MHRDQHIGIELADLGDDLLEVVGGRGAEMEAAHDGVHLLDARDLLRLAHRVDDADMAAGADHDQPLVPDVEAGGVLVDMLVGHDLAFHLRRQVVAGVAAGAVLERELDHGVRQHLLDAGALDLAGGEGLPADHDRALRQHHLHVVGRDIAAVEHAEVVELTRRRRAVVALAEIVLAAGVERQFRGQRLAVTVEEADEPAPMIEMAVAQDQRVDLLHVDAEQVHVPGQHLGRPAIVEQEGARLAATLGFKKQRQAPFAVQRPLGIAGPARLDLHARCLLRLEEEVGGAVDQHAHGELVDGRHLDRGCAGDLDAGEAACCRRCRECRGSLQDVAPPESFGHDNLHWAMVRLDAMIALYGPDRPRFGALPGARAVRNPTPLRSAGVAIPRHDLQGDSP